MVKNRQWWKECIIYQVYPRSFKDSNADGIGDLEGIRQKLPYIKSIGIDLIWLCPIFSSPNFDNGYDISDYKKIMDDFGTMADFDNLLAEIHDLGMKLILDLVANHSSDQHPWFLEAKKSESNPYRDYYYWKKGVREKLPNNWPGFFSGRVWEYEEETSSFYLHLFSKHQPDLNWENPQLRKEIYKIMRFWLNKGVDGFRMDVITMISKDTSFADTAISSFNEIINKVYANGPHVHEFIQEMNREVISHYDMMTVGEGTGVNPDQANLYVGRDRNELNMIFNFDHMFLGNGMHGKYDPVPWTMSAFKKIFKTWNDALGNDGWNSVFLGNHDFPRIVSRFGDDKKYHKESAKLLATLLLTMKGTVFIYQGDEIGMTNVKYESIDQYRDIETINSYQHAQKEGKDIGEFMKIIYNQSRDNARTPMQWEDRSNAGFSSSKPWIDVNKNYTSINVAQNERDPNSILQFYKTLIAIRKKYLPLVYGDYYQIENTSEEIFAYTRILENESFLIVLNFSGENTTFILADNKSVNSHNLIISNYKNPKISKDQIGLRPWEAMVFKL